ncbi:MAG: hypothetical protein ACPGU4_08895, partial [Flavobacteriales bacterium]
MKHLIPALVIGFFALSSCTSQGGSNAEKPSALDSLETLVFANEDVKADSKTAMSLVREYAKFYKANQPDSLA